MSMEKITYLGTKTNIFQFIVEVVGLREVLALLLIVSISSIKE